MNDKILFQLDCLTVYQSKLIFGDAKVLYPEIAASSIDDSKPYAWLSLVSLVSFVPLVFMMAWGKIVFGLYLPLTAFLISLLPAIGLVIFGFTHRMKCLFISIDGRSVAVLKGHRVEMLERAHQAIQTAKQAV